MIHTEAGDTWVTKNKISPQKLKGSHDVDPVSNVKTKKMINKDEQ